jgi:hypothetical protein
VVVNSQPDFPVAFSRLAVLPALVPDGMDVLQVERILTERLALNGVKAVPIVITRQAIFELTGGVDPDASVIPRLAEKIGADAFLIPALMTASSKTTGAYATGLWGMYSSFVAVGTIQKHQTSVSLTIIDVNGRVLMRGTGFGSTQLNTFYGLLGGVYEQIIKRAFNERYWERRRAAEPITPVVHVPRDSGVVTPAPNMVDGPEGPVGALSVAYRQRAEGALSQSLHSLKLDCDGRDCTLVTVTLNQCIEGAFFPKVEVASTLDDNLSIESFDGGVLVLEQNLPDVFAPNEQTVIKYRFEYRPRGDLQPHALGELVAFSGIATKNSEVLRRMISWELVPLEGRFVTVQLDCPVSLQGVPGEESAGD